MVGVDRALDHRGERLAGIAAELVDDVQDLERSPVSCLVELEVGRPDGVRADRAHRAGDDTDASEGLLPSLVRDTQPLVAPQAVDGLVVHPPAGRPCRGPAPIPAGTLDRELPEEGPQRELLLGGDGRGQALGGSRLADDPAGEALGDPELPLEHPDGAPAAVRGQMFPSQLLQHRLLELGLGDELLQAGILGLQGLQALRVRALHPAVLVPPAVEGRLGDLEVATGLLDRLPLAE